MLSQVSTALRVHGVTKKYGALSVLNGVDLALGRNERHALIGPNGAGKSTLFHVASGRTVATTGTIHLDCHDITHASAHDRVRLGMGRSFQITNLFARLSVEQNAQAALMWQLGEKYQFWRPVSANKRLREEVAHMLELVGLTHRKDVRVGLLSYAEQRALEIGIAASVGKHVILLDEPTAGMSQAETERAIALILEVSNGKAILIVEHDMKVVFDVADRVSVLMEGRVIATGTPREIQDSDIVRAAYLGNTGQH